MPRHFFGFFHLCFQSAATFFSWFFIDVFEVLCWFPLVFHSCFRRFASLWLIFLLRFSRKCVHNSMFFARSFRSFASIFFDLSHFWGEFRLLGIMKAVINAADLGAEGAQKPRGSPSGRVFACFVNGWFISDLKILIKNNEKRCQKIWRERVKGSIFAALSVKNAKGGGLERQPRELRYWRSDEVGERQRVAESFKIFSKKVAKKFGGYKNLQYFCTRFRQGSHTRVTESKKREQERRSLR